MRSVAALYETVCLLKPFGRSVVDTSSTFFSLFFDIIEVALLLPSCGSGIITYNVLLLLLLEGFSADVD